MPEGSYWAAAPPEGFVKTHSKGPSSSRGFSGFGFGFLTSSPQGFLCPCLELSCIFPGQAAGPDYTLRTTGLDSPLLVFAATVWSLCRMTCCPLMCRFHLALYFNFNFTKSTFTGINYFSCKFLSEDLIYPLGFKSHHILPLERLPLCVFFRNHCCHY